jgi:uncharacterized protein YcfL
MKNSYLFFLVLTSLILFGCSSASKTNQEVAEQNISIAASVTPATAPTANPKTRDYSKNIDDLRASFNKDKGKVRLVTLLSPT